MGDKLKHPEKKIIDSNELNESQEKNVELKEQKNSEQNSIEQNQDNNNKNNNIDEDDEEELIGNEDDGKYEPSDEGMFGLRKDLFFQSWELDQDSEDKKVVILLHDLGAHSGVWQPAVDLRAHGRSNGVPGHVESINSLADDAEQIIRLAKRREGVKKVSIIGHGLGGLIV